MKFIICASLFIVVLTLAATPTRACYCGVGDVPSSFKRARAVFVGLVTDIIDPQTSNPEAPLPGQLFTIEFIVEKSWKGVPLGSREFRVLSAQGHYGCFAYPQVHKGERYLVYADAAYSVRGEDPNWNIISVCNRTMLVQFLPRPRDANSFDDMQALDAITALPSFRLDFKSAWRWKPTSKIGS